MIIKSFDLKKNLKKNINFYLLYGPNSGLIEDTINQVLKPNFSKNVYNYDESEILTNIDNFNETVLNKSFFDNDKLIIINRETDKILNIVEEILEKKIDDLKIIIKANILEKKSKLRNFFEKNTNTIIVPNYEDNSQTLLYLAQNFFKNKQIKISPQNTNFIIERSKGNRTNLKNELEKIASYSEKKLSINLDEILKITNSDNNYNASELTDNCLALNKKKTLMILNENNPSLEDNIIILKTFLYKLKRLKKLKVELNSKKDLDYVLSSYKPPIFWKDKNLIKHQLQIWSLEQIKSLIRNIRKFTHDKNFPIMIDEEGSTVSRLRNIINHNVSAKYFGNLYSVNNNLGTNLYKNYLRSLCKILKTIGININTIPVLDILRKNTSPIFLNRCFSDKKEIVKKLGKITVTECHAHKILSVMKHMPGHGCTISDSHFIMPKVNFSKNKLVNNDLYPFKSNPARLGMTAHILYSKIDSNNVATFSKKIIKDIIRKKIGFKGILMSDDISMKALKFDLITNAKKSLDAGCNLVLYCAGNINDNLKLIKSVPYIDDFTSKKTSEIYKILR